MYLISIYYLKNLINVAGVPLKKPKQFETMGKLKLYGILVPKGQLVSEQKSLQYICCFFDPNDDTKKTFQN